MVEGIRQGDIPGVQLRWRQALPAPADVVRPWLADDLKLRRWLADEVEIDAAGGVALSGELEGRALRERGATLERAADRWRLSFRRLEADWGADTILTLALEPHAAGCEVMVFQQGFQRLPLSIGLTEWELYRRRWRAAFERLAAAVSGTRPAE